MKITEMTTRECCDITKDLVKCEYLLANKEAKYFCKHCGQLFGVRSYTDEAGDTDTEIYKLRPGN